MKFFLCYLKVSRIIVKRTNFPRRGTTREVGGIISASSRKNTVRESKMLMDKLTYIFDVIKNKFSQGRETERS